MAPSRKPSAGKSEIVSGGEGGACAETAAAWPSTAAGMAAVATQAHVPCASVHNSPAKPGFPARDNDGACFFTYEPADQDGRCGASVAPGRARYSRGRRERADAAAEEAQARLTRMQDVV